MKFLRQSFIIGIFTLLASLHVLWAMDDIPMYDEEKTEDLRRRLKVIERTPEDVIKCSVEERMEIEELVKHGANPNIAAPSCTYRAIHFAAIAGNVDLIMFLHKHGADIHVETFNGNTPIMWAAKYGHKNAAAQLIALGAEIEPENSVGPLVLAAERGHQEIVHHLISFGAKGERAWSRAIGEAKNILSAYFSQEEVSPGKNWLCFMIRLKNNGELLKHIFSYFPRDVLEPLINQLDNYGHTPLDIAMVTRNIEAINLLLAHGAAPLRGLYGGIILASRIPEWRKPMIAESILEPSIYDKMLAATSKQCWLTSLACEQYGAPKEIIFYVTQIMLSWKKY